MLTILMRFIGLGLMIVGSVTASAAVRFPNMDLVRLDLEKNQALKNAVKTNLVTVLTQLERKGSVRLGSGGWVCAKQGWVYFTSEKMKCVPPHQLKGHGNFVPSANFLSFIERVDFSLHWLAAEDYCHDSSKDPSCARLAKAAAQLKPHRLNENWLRLLAGDFTPQTRAVARHWNSWAAVLPQANAEAVGKCDIVDKENRIKTPNGSVALDPGLTKAPGDFPLISSCHIAHGETKEDWATLTDDEVLSEIGGRAAPDHEKNSKNLNRFLTSENVAQILQQDKPRLAALRQAVSEKNPDKKLAWINIERSPKTLATVQLETLQHDYDSIREIMKEWGATDQQIEDFTLYRFGPALTLEATGELKKAGTRLIVADKSESQPEGHELDMQFLAEVLATCPKLVNEANQRTDPESLKTSKAVGDALIHLKMPSEADLTAFIYDPEGLDDGIEVYRKLFERSIAATQGREKALVEAALREPGNGALEFDWLHRDTLMAAFRSACGAPATPAAEKPADPAPAVEKEKGEPPQN